MMTRKSCPSCTCSMEWKDEQFVCPLCGHSELLEDTKSFCEVHACVVDITVFRLWQSSCFGCRKEPTCVGYKRGKEYKPHGAT